MPQGHETAKYKDTRCQKNVANPAVCIPLLKEAIQSKLMSSTVGEKLSDHQNGRKIVFCDVGSLAGKSTNISNNDAYHGCPAHAGAISKVVALS